MSLPTRTLEQILIRALAHFRTSFPGFPLGTKKFLGRSGRAIGLVLWGLHKSLEDLDADVVPSAKMAADLLADWLFNLGLPDGEGGFGPLKPTTASGGLANITGVNGTVYTDGLTATAEDGATQIELSGTVTIPGSPPGFGSVEGAFIAVTKGTAGNLPAGTVLTWDAAPLNADPSFTLTAGLGDAIDIEDSPSRYTRIKQRLQNPPRGGKTEDIIFWAELVKGVAEIYVYPRRGGTGTVDVVITTKGSNADDGTSRVPTTALINSIQASFDSNRPVASEQVNAIKPTTRTAHDVQIKVTPSQAKYRFDWDDSAGYTVDTYPVAANPLRLTLNTVAPASLKNAIDAYINGLGAQPRLQIMSTGSHVNKAIGTSKTAVFTPGPSAGLGWSDSGGKTTIALDSLPNGWVAPVATDVVHAYGPAVAAIAQGVVDIFDGLGPSKNSGFADDEVIWDDTLSISGITAAAENARDTDGSKFIQKVPVGDVTIDGVVADVTGIDNGITGPEILFLGKVAVVAA